MAHNVFVAMPFKHAFDPVLDLIKDAGHLLNTHIARLDEQPTTGSILSHIRAQIDHSDLVVAVVSEENGNVYYEIGLAHCQKKPVVLLTADPAALKFDLRDHRAVIYDPKDPMRARDELVRTMKAALDRTSDPDSFIKSALGPADTTVATVIQQAQLARPVQIMFRKVDPTTRELAMEVKDFLGTTVRAIFDVNGILITLKRMRG